MRYLLPIALVGALAIYHGHFGLSQYPNLLTSAWCFPIYAITIYGLISAQWREWASQISTMLGLMGTVLGFLLALSSGGVESLETSSLALAFLTTLAGIGGALLCLIQQRLEAAP